jgi:hypothetical protein
MAVSPSQQTPAKSRLPSSFRPLKEQPSEELNLSTDELLFLPLTELELFCEPFESGFTELEDLELPPEDVPLSVTELEEIAPSSPLLLETSATGSGSALLELLSHAVNMARRTAKVRTLLKIFTEDLQL